MITRKNATGQGLQEFPGEKIIWGSQPKGGFLEEAILELHLKMTSSLGGREEHCRDEWVTPRPEGGKAQSPQRGLGRGRRDLERPART